MSALIAQELVRTFGKTRALDGLSFEVAPGELYGLVGPDGAGKTTTLRILAGVMKPTDGAAYVFGKDPMSTDEHVRSSIGYMPQQYSLYGDLSVDENLHFFSKMFCLDRATYQERRERLLGITRLGRFTDRRADALSGGMYKKLALACSLLSRPDVLILDEPTNGVDPVSRRELWALLFELVEEGMAVIVSTAYMDEAERCHRVGLLFEGRLLVEGDPTALLADYRRSQPSATFEDVFLATVRGAA
ncbi:MAG: ABC transporter ATP-binding protein [Deltaproteobacteria bacterium]